jgi:hypothetical protein
MTWNSNGLLSGSRELALSNLLENNNIDVLVATETEIPASAAPFATTGYVTFLPLVREKERTRMIMLVKSSLVTLASVRIRTDLMDLTACQSVWVTVESHTKDGHSHGGLTIGGTYRQWSRMGTTLNVEQERVQVAALKSQMERALLMSGRVVFTGDLNLDTHRKGEYTDYNRCTMMEDFLVDTAALGYIYSPTAETWVSYGFHGDDRTNHRGCLNHVYAAGIKDRSIRQQW